MKTTFSFVLLMIVMLSTVSAKEADKTKPHNKVHKEVKDKKMSIVEVKEKIETKTEAPCDTNAKDLMKKLEEEQKKKAAKGQAFGLQGNNSSGCTIGN